MDYNTQFSDFKLTPHIAISPNNFNPDIFASSQFNNPFMLPKQHFYPQFSKFDEALLNNDIFMQTCMDPNSLQPQFVFTTQNTGNGKNISRNNGKTKGKADTKGKAKKEKKVGSSNKGKR